MPNVTLYPGDNRLTLRRLIDEGVRVHSVVCDPPYGLVSVQKRFGKEGAAAARTERNDDIFARLSGGFMGKQWDATEIERDPEFWRLIWEILLPGGYVFAFSGSRTGHWQAVAMETAGFIMHPMHGWIYSTGFPKAHAADKAIDATLLRGSARTTDIRQMRMGDDYEPSGRGRVNYDHGGGSAMNGATGPYKPATPEAAQWEGWAYGTQAQKPALEPIYLGQKPFTEKTGAANLLKHGVGAVNIDGCRVNPGETVPGGGRSKRGASAGGGSVYGNGGSADNAPSHAMGRHPANLILDGSPEVVAMFPTSNGSGAARTLKRGQRDDESGWGMSDQPGELRDAGTGSAARFFHQFTPDTDPLFYHPKAGKQDRAGSKHPTVKPIALMQYLIRHITPPGGTVLDPFAGSGTTAEAAQREGFNCILMEAEPEYVEFLQQRFADVQIDPNQIDADPLRHYLIALGFALP